MLSASDPFLQFQAAFAGLLAGRGEAGDPALARAVAVHRNTAAKAAQDALAANYPVLRALFGEAPFDACAAAAARRSAADAVWRGLRRLPARLRAGRGGALHARRGHA